jgi:hypothetical protein
MHNFTPSPTTATPRSVASPSSGGGTIPSPGHLESLSQDTKVSKLTSPGTRVFDSPPKQPTHESQKRTRLEAWQDVEVDKLRSDPALEGLDEAALQRIARNQVRLKEAHRMLTAEMVLQELCDALVKKSTCDEVWEVLDGCLDDESQRHALAPFIGKQYETRPQQIHQLFLAISHFHTRKQGKQATLWELQWTEFTNRVPTDVVEVMRHLGLAPTLGNTARHTTRNDYVFTSYDELSRMVARCTSQNMEFNGAQGTTTYEPETTVVTVILDNFALSTGNKRTMLYDTQQLTDFMARVSQDRPFNALVTSVPNGLLIPLSFSSGDLGSKLVNTVCGFLDHPSTLNMNFEQSTYFWHRATDTEFTSVMNVDGTLDFVSSVITSVSNVGGNLPTISFGLDNNTVLLGARTGPPTSDTLLGRDLIHFCSLFALDSREKPLRCIGVDNGLYKKVRQMVRLFLAWSHSQDPERNCLDRDLVSQAVVSAEVPVAAVAHVPITTASVTIVTSATTVTTTLTTTITNPSASVISMPTVRTSARVRSQITAGQPRGAHLGTDFLVGSEYASAITRSAGAAPVNEETDSPDDNDDAVNTTTSTPPQMIAFSSVAPNSREWKVETVSFVLFQDVIWHGAFSDVLLDRILSFMKEYAAVAAGASGTLGRPLGQFTSIVSSQLVEVCSRLGVSNMTQGDVGARVLSQVHLDVVRYLTSDAFLDGNGGKLPTAELDTVLILADIWHSNAALIETLLLDANEAHCGPLWAWYQGLDTAHADITPAIIRSRKGLAHMFWAIVVLCQSLPLALDEVKAKHGKNIEHGRTLVIDIAEKVKAVTGAGNQRKKQKQLLDLLSPEDQRDMNLAALFRLAYHHAPVLGTFLDVMRNGAPKHILPQLREVYHVARAQHNTSIAYNLGLQFLDLEFISHKHPEIYNRALVSFAGAGSIGIEHAHSWIEQNRSYADTTAEDLTLLMCRKQVIDEANEFVSHGMASRHGKDKTMVNRMYHTEIQHTTNDIKQGKESLVKLFDNLATGGTTLSNARYHEFWSHGDTLGRRFNIVLWGTRSRPSSKPHLDKAMKDETVFLAPEFLAEKDRVKPDAMGRVYVNEATTDRGHKWTMEKCKAQDHMSLNVFDDALRLVGGAGGSERVSWFCAGEEGLTMCSPKPVGVGGDE